MTQNAVLRGLTSSLLGNMSLWWYLNQAAAQTRAGAPCWPRHLWIQKTRGDPGDWFLLESTGGPRRTRWLLLLPVTAEQPTRMSLLRVQGATESAMVCEGTGVSPQTGHETNASHKSPWFRAADPMLTPTAPPGDQLFCGERNHQYTGVDSIHLQLSLTVQL